MRFRGFWLRRSLLAVDKWLRPIAPGPDAFDEEMRRAMGWGRVVMGAESFLIGVALAFTAICLWQAIHAE
jgi:hypothetical protein